MPLQGTCLARKSELISIATYIAACPIYLSAVCGLGLLVSLNETSDPRSLLA